MIGALIGAGASLLGGVLGNKAQAKANAANIKQAKIANAQQERWANKNYNFQKDAAKKSIQWRVNDAKNAGIHPIYALGAQGFTPSPISVGSTSANIAPETALAEGISNSGQHLGRAIEAYQSQEQRTANILSLQRMGLENELLASQIARVRQAGQPPGIVQSPHIDGQAVVATPHEITASAVPGVTAGAPAETTLYRTPTGGYTPGMSEDYQEGQGESWIGAISHGIRNYIPPFLGSYHKGLPEPKAGHTWVWNPVGFEYVQTPIPNYELNKIHRRN